MKLLKVYWGLKWLLLCAYIIFFLLSLLTTYTTEYIYSNIVVSFIFASFVFVSMLILCPIIIYIVDKFYE